MQLITLTKTGEGSSDVRNLDFFKFPFQVGLGTKVTGSATYTVEYTFSDPAESDFNASTATWYSITALASKTGNETVEFTVPCRGIRVTNAAGSTGTVLLYIQQAGTI